MKRLDLLPSDIKFYYVIIFYCLPASSIHLRCLGKSAAKSYFSKMVSRALALMDAIRSGLTRASSTLSTICCGEKKSTRIPLTPSRIISVTGGVLEAIIKHPADIASNIDHDKTKGLVK